MFKNNLNPNFVRWVLKTILYGFLIGTVAMLLLAALTGCNTAKQTARKDKQALDRVTAKRPLIDSVAPIVFGLYPCANDTFTTFLSGGIDSVPYPVPVLDEKQRAHVIDSLRTYYMNDCYAAVSASYDAGYNNATIDLKNQKVPVKRPDTLAHSIVDRQKYNQYEKQIAALREKSAALEEASKQKDTQLADSKKDTNKLIWLFIAACVALSITNGLWVYSKFKNPLK